MTAELIVERTAATRAHARRGMTAGYVTHYVLMCNIVEEEEGGEIESQFAEGMVTDFNVL